MFNYVNITAYRREMRHEPSDSTVQSSELRGEAALLLIYTAANRKKAECGRTKEVPRSSFPLAS